MGANCNRVELFGARLVRHLATSASTSASAGLPSNTTAPSRRATTRCGRADGRQLVGGDEQRGAVGVGAAEQLEQRVAAGAVEADERLVDEQQLERPDEGQGDGRLLAQAPAERRSAGRRARSASPSVCEQVGRRAAPSRRVPCSRAMYSRCSHTLRSS